MIPTVTIIQLQSGPFFVSTVYAISAMSAVPQLARVSTQPSFLNPGYCTRVWWTCDMSPFGRHVRPERVRYPHGDGGAGVRGVGGLRHLQALRTQVSRRVVL